MIFDLRREMAALNVYLSCDKHTAVGVAGEQWVALALKAAGYEVRITHERGLGDLRVVDGDGVVQYVEVKTARANVRGKWCFTLFKRKGQRVKTDHRRADVVVLVVVTRSGGCVPYVIPAGMLNQNSVQISGHPGEYVGKYAQYKQGEEIRL